jgi:hypothetical protein
MVSLIYPFGGDQGNYGYIGLVILNGGIPFTDVLSFKPQFTGYLHALAFLSFGKSMLSIRYLDLIWTFCTALSLYTLSYLWMRNRLISFFSGFLYVFQYYLLDYWSTAQTDHWLNLPVILAFICLYYVISEYSQMKSRFLFSVGCGLLMGVSLFFKYSIAPVLVFQTLSPLFIREIKIKDRIWLGAGIAMGTLAFVLVIFSWMYFQGNLEDFFEFQKNVIFPYAKVQSTIGFGGKINRFIEVFESIYGLIFWLGLFGLVSLYRYIRSSSFKVGSQIQFLFFILTWLFSTMFSVWLQGKFFGYQFEVILPACCLLGGIAIDTLWLSIAVPKMKGIHFLLVTLFVLFLIYATTGYQQKWMHLSLVTSNRIQIEDLWGRWVYGKERDFPLPEIMMISQYIRRESRQEETVFVWGHNPIINVLSNRLGPNRFTTGLVVASEGIDKKFRNELVQSLITAPPDWMIVAKNDYRWWRSTEKTDSKALLVKYPAITAMLESRYVHLKSLKYYEIYRRVPE